MNKLFIELYLDENVSVIVARILQARGFVVVTTDDAGRKGTSDPDQLQYAIDNGFAIASMNRTDFEQLAKEYFEAGKDHPGIFILADNSPQVIAQRLSDVLDRNTADEIANQIIYI